MSTKSKSSDNNRAKYNNNCFKKEHKMKFLDIRTDFAFKKVFGSEDSKTRLMSFLNSVISFPGKAIITKVTKLSPKEIAKIKKANN